MVMVNYISWFSSIALYLEDYLMYKQDTLFFYPFIFLFFFLVNIISICCSSMIKVTDLEYFIFIAFTFKLGVKCLLAKGGDTGRGYR